MGSNFPPETYSPLEEKRIGELRSRLSDLDPGASKHLHPSQLIRWLRARNLEVAKAEVMLRNSLEWMKVNGIDGILEREEMPEDFKRLAPIAKIGVDGDGYPIILVPMGRRYITEMLNKWGMEMLLRLNIILCETVMDILRVASEEQGRPVTQLVMIIDMEGFNYRQFASKQCREFLSRTQSTRNDNYPEVLRYCLVVNAPKAFHMVWCLMKPIIPKETLEKVDVCGVDKEKWKKAIAEKVPLDGLPTHWGGTRQGEDEYCSGDTKLWFMGGVPLGFLEFDKPFPMEKEDDDAHRPVQLQKVMVGPRDSLKLTLSVRIPNSSIAWRFRVEQQDIGFQIVDQDGNELVPYKSVSSKTTLEQGQEKCHKCGVYTVTFDNSYSWTRAKTIYYHVSVIDKLVGTEDSK